MYISPIKVEDVCYLLLKKTDDGVVWFSSLLVFSYPGWQCLALKVQLPLMIRMHNNSSQILAPPWCLCHLVFVRRKDRCWCFFGCLVDVFDFCPLLSRVFLGVKHVFTRGKLWKIHWKNRINEFWCKISCWLAIGMSFSKKKKLFKRSIGNIQFTKKVKCESFTGPLCSVLVKHFHLSGKRTQGLRTERLKLRCEKSARLMGLTCDHCWWQPEIRRLQRTSWGTGSWNPIIYKVLAPSRWLALGFQPSTVSWATARDILNRQMWAKPWCFRNMDAGM